MYNTDVETWMHASVNCLKISIPAVPFLISAVPFLGPPGGPKNGTASPSKENSLCRECAVPKTGPRAVVFTRRMKAFGMDSSHVDLLRRVTATVMTQLSRCDAQHTHRTRAT